MGQRPHTANDGAADLLHASGQITTEIVSPTLAHAIGQADQAVTSSDEVMAEARASRRTLAADPLPESTSLPRGPSSDPNVGGERSRAYIMISKQGNTTKFDRGSMISSL